MINKNILRTSALAIFSVISFGAHAQTSTILEKCGMTSKNDRISNSRICVGIQLLKTANTHGKRQDVVTISNKIFKANRKDVTDGRIGAKLEEITFQVNKTTSAVLTLSSAVRPGASAIGRLTFHTPKDKKVVVERIEMKAVRSGPQ